VIGGPPVSPARIPVRAEKQGGRGGGGFKVVELTEGVYIAYGSPALTGQPLWVNVSEEGTW
jgi:hypothetical protein